MNSHPTGTVTFLFTDIEGSTKLAEEHPDKWESLRERHHSILQSAIDLHNGYVFQIVGDAFCAAFHTAGDALLAALKSQNDFHTEEWGDAIIKVRMGIHTGKAEIQTGGNYQGYLTMSRVQRVMSIAYGGQILISNTSAGLIRGELPEGVSLLDMKEHRLKGLLNSEHLWQAVAPDLPKDFPLLQSLNDIPNNLPVQLTSFIGRQNEIAELKRELNDHHHVTLTGSGGTGKTRLSLQVAAEVMDSFPDGVWFLELAPVTDPALVPNTLANLLGLRESAKTKRSISELICGYLHTRKALLIFDNCEHLIEACAQLADLLLRSCKDVRILASSREALGVAGEMAWHVPSLSLPDLKNLPAIEQLSQYEAVRLFIERVTLVQPHFLVTKENAPAIAQICFRLDGIPLAIELAAARVKVLKAEQIAERLTDRFRLLTGGSRTALPRQQTLRAMIDWSYDLLAENEKLLLRCLAVFTGGWTLEFAEQVCSNEKIDSYEVLDLLGRLVDKSLVSVNEDGSDTRYRMLETVRQYAREKLFESGEGEKARDQHLQAFVQLAEKAEPEIRSFNQLMWLDRLDEEIDNLRAALEWSQERNKDSFLRLASALWRFWSVRGYIPDLEWLPKALVTTEEVRTVIRARALGRAAYVSVNHGDPHRGRKWAKQAEVLSLALDDKPGLAMALSQQGDLEENYALGLELLEQALILAREIGDQWLAAGILNSRAGSLFNQNDLSSAKSFFEQALKEARSLGDERRISYGLGALGQIALAQGESQIAEKMFKEAFAHAQEIRDNVNVWGYYWFMLLTKLFLEDFTDAKEMSAETFKLAQIAGGKSYIGQTLLLSVWMDLAQGHESRTVEQIEEGLLLAKQTTDLYTITNLIYWLGEASRRKGEFAQAGKNYIEALTIYQKENLAYGYCVCFEGLGMLAIDQGEVAKGAHLLGARERLRASEFVNDYFPFMVREREAHIATARMQLSEDEFDKAWAEGKAMSTEEAVQFALEAINE